MWVTLRLDQMERVQRVVRAWDAQIADAIIEVSVQHTSKQRRYEAPYVAWDVARKLMTEEVFNARGAKRKRTPQSTMTALRRITAGCNTMDRHPAMKGAGMATGLPQPVLPVWRLPERYQFERLYRPLPILGQPFVLLVPDRTQVSGITVTVWEPDRLGLAAGLRLANEQLHLSLLR